MAAKKKKNTKKKTKKVAKKKKVTKKAPAKVEKKEADVVAEEPKFTKKELEKKNPSAGAPLGVSSGRTQGKKKTTPKKEVEDELIDEENEKEMEVVEDESQEDKVEEVESSDEDKMDDVQIDKELNDIYGSANGTMLDMKHFEKKKRSRFVAALTVLVGSCLLLGGVAWLGFFVFQPQSRFSEEEVILSIAGDEEVVSGQEVHYRIRYRNAQNVPLSKVMLQVRYPEGFVFEKSDPEPTSDKQDEWILGSLEEQDSGFIDVWGKMYGGLENKQSFRGFLNYIPSNFSSEFQKVATLSTEVTGSPVELSLTGLDKVSSGVETEFVVALKNQDTSSTEHLALVLEPGENFTIKSSDLPADEDNQYQWTLDEVEEEQEIKIIGVFGGLALDDKAEIEFKLLSWKDTSREDDGYIIQSQKHEVEIAKTEVSSNLVMNGASGDFSAQPGDLLSASIIVQNNGGSAIRNGAVSVMLDAPSANRKSILDWVDLDDPSDGWIVGEQLADDFRRGKISWSSRDISSLGSISPGDEVVIDFSIPIKTADDTDLTEYETYEILANVDVDYDQDSEEKELSSNQIKILVNSDVGLDVQDDTLGDEHTITWILNNTFHELRDIKLEADLYGDISVSEDDFVVPAGSASYDADTKKFSWQVDAMPTSLDVLALQFSVVIEEENLSQTNLTSKIRFSARDTVTGEDIILVGDEVLLNGSN